MKGKLLVLIILAGLIGGGIFVLVKAPEWKQGTEDILAQAKDARLDQDKWAQIEQDAKKLPNVYPLNHVRSITKHAKASIDIVHQIPTNIPSFEPEKPIKTDQIDQIFQYFEQLDGHVTAITKHVHKLPTIGLAESQIQELEAIKIMLEKAEDIFSQRKTLEKVYQDMKEDEERILVLLQNQNEPRSTGGFVGSVLLIDFEKESIQWEFKDIYALDRLVPEEAKLQSPDFFAQINPQISLRDANMHPDFATSSQEYIRFFESIDEKPPHTIIGINLNILHEILGFTGPITLEKWNIVADQNNFDTVLSFLVEAKIAGRFNVKDPVLEFAKSLMNPKNWENIDLQALATFDHPTFLEQKNLQAYSQNPKLQRLFSKWNIDGAMQPHPDVDNFLHFDFVSVGANKTEKFMWTKIWHDSMVLQSGKVLNSVEIQRRHNIQPGELDQILGTDTWFENIRDQLNDEIRWKLSEGQNRTIIRVSVPNDAKLITQRNPSGDITETVAEDENRKIFDVPMYVSAGEKNTVVFTYETQMKKGSHNWRPYVLQLIGTPGRAQTSFLQTISSHGEFKAETFNIGRPVDLIDQDFRSVIDFRN